MTTPANYALSLYKGDTYRWKFVVWTDKNKTIPADLTDATPKAEIRDKPGGTLITALVCELELPNVINAELSASASAMLPAKCSWDLQLSYTNGDVATLLAGAVAVRIDVTDTAVVTP